jgi:hypothetical protein
MPMLCVPRLAHLHFMCTACGFPRLLPRTKTDGGDQRESSQRNYPRWNQFYPFHKISTNFRFNLQDRDITGKESLHCMIGARPYINLASASPWKHQTRATIARQARAVDLPDQGLLRRVAAWRGTTSRHHRRWSHPRSWSFTEGRLHRRQASTKPRCRCLLSIDRFRCRR